jgi:uncharacterized protein YycO
VISLRFCDLGWPLFSRSVSFWSGHWSNHVDLLTDPGVMISAAPPFGVQEWPERVLVARRPEVVSLPCSPEQRARVLKAARALIGKPYDYRAVVGWPFGNWDDPAAWYCSELVAFALAEGGVLAVPPGTRRISPGDLYSLCVAEP